MTADIQASSPACEVIPSLPFGGQGWALGFLGVTAESKGKTRLDGRWQRTCSQTEWTGQEPRGTVRLGSPPQGAHQSDSVGGGGEEREGGGSTADGNPEPPSSANLLLWLCNALSLVAEWKRE